MMWTWEGVNYLDFYKILHQSSKYYSILDGEYKKIEAHIFRQLYTWQNQVNVPINQDLIQTKHLLCYMKTNLYSC